MASAVKKNTFDELYQTFNTTLKHVDELLLSAKKEVDKVAFFKNKIWKDKAPNIKTFFLNIEKEAIDKTAVELSLTEATVRERWRTLMMPFPLYVALEKGDISYTKAKIFANYTLDIEKDSKFMANVLNKIKDIKGIKEAKAIVEAEFASAKLWNESDVAIRYIATQHGIVE